LLVPVPLNVTVPEVPVGWPTKIATPVACVVPSPVDVLLIIVAGEPLIVAAKVPV
jgi:hypothetical protein